MATIASANLLQELLRSADSPDDIEAVESLIIEEEQRERQRGRWNATTLTEVSEVFGLALQTVKQWRIESPPMPGVEGCYPIPAIIKWRLAKLQQSDVQTARKQQEYELGQVKLEQVRLDLAREKGQILDRADVELWAATAIVELREGIMQLPEMLAASSPPELKNFTRAETERHCRDLLTATRRRLELAEIRGQRNDPTDVNPVA